MSAAFSRDAVERMLVNKLKATPIEDRDHRWYALRVDGVYVGRTKVSTGTKYKTLNDNLIAQMSKQCLVNSRQFMALVQCTMDFAEWRQSLVDRGVLPRQ